MATMAQTGGQDKVDLGLPSASLEAGPRAASRWQVASPGWSPSSPAQGLQDTGPHDPRSSVESLWPHTGLLPLTTQCR